MTGRRPADGTLYKGRDGIGHMQGTGLLLAAYRAEVEYRCREFREDGMAAENCRKLAAFLTADKPKFGVMLCGICGNGKTTMLHAFQPEMNWLSDYGAFGNGRKGLVAVDAR